MAGGPHSQAPLSACVAVLTASDSRGVDEDGSGRLIQELLRAAGHSIHDYRIEPDDPQKIRATVRGWLAQDDCQLVIVNGGTGMARRDRTYDAVSALLDQRIDGFGEIFRQLSFEEIGSAAMLSRAVAGVALGKPLFSVPGSTGAVRLAMERLILPELGHLLRELRR
jgi:molybdenum cofactor biosynthesis protein B